MHQVTVLQSVAEKYGIRLSQLEVLELVFDDMENVDFLSAEDMEEKLNNLLSNKVHSRIAGNRVLSMVFQNSKITDAADRITQKGRELLNELARITHLSNVASDNIVSDMT